MERDLLELLSRYSIAHPTRILSITGNEGTIRLSLSGWQWWRDDKNDQEIQYEIRFAGIDQGKLDMAAVYGRDWDEALDDFVAEPLRDAPWAQPRGCAIYCSDHLPAPFQLYSVLENHLDEEDSFFRASYFLNCNETRPVGSFADIAGSNSYLLATCPEKICGVLKRELDRQHVRHTVIFGRGDDVLGLLRIRFIGSDFLCASAIAILPDDLI